MDPKIIPGAGERVASIRDRWGQMQSAWQEIETLDLGLPREVRDEFEEMTRVLSRERALPGDSKLRASLRKLSSTDASRYAVTLTNSFQSGCPPWSPRTVTKG